MNSLLPFLSEGLRARPAVFFLAAEGDQESEGGGRRDWSP